jgi:hypothetical protein
VVNELSKTQRSGHDLAGRRLDAPSHGWPEVDVDPVLGIPEPRARGPNVQKCLGGPDWRPCTRWAGEGTVHPGLGRCRQHEGLKERAAGAWMMAHVIARALDISPWEALLLAVRRAAAWSAFYESKLAAVQEGDDDALRPGGEAYDWVQAAERVNDKMARYAKMAVDAGVAAAMVAQARNEGETIARVLNAALGVAQLSIEQEAAIRAALRQALLDLDSPRQVTDS